MTDCPCCSGADYDACCGPMLSGEKKVSTATELMRSRYTAYTKGDLEYIKSTMYPSTRADFDEDSARIWSRDSEWLGLEILSTEAGGEDDSEGTVEFVAKYTQDDEFQDHHEIAKFKREGGRWYFYDGKFVGNEPYVREQPKVGRNDPCPCGSGKKFKKCCGK